MNNKRAIYKFQIFDFSIFKISNIGLLWSQITIFIIEISLKLHLHRKNGWNNPNSHRFCLKSWKSNIWPFLAAQNFIAHTNIQIHVTGSIFIVNWFFLMLVTMSSIRINNNWNYQKMLITETMIPLRAKKNLVAQTPLKITQHYMVSTVLLNSIATFPTVNTSASHLSLRTR